MTAPTTVIQNLVDKYGYQRFLTLVANLQNNIQDTEIAKEFGVSKQRVGQWKKHLGEVRTSYTLYDDVEEYIRGKEGGGGGRTSV